MTSPSSATPTSNTPPPAFQGEDAALYDAAVSLTRVDDRGQAFGREFGERPRQSGLKLLNLFRQRTGLLVVQELGLDSGLH